MKKIRNWRSTMRLTRSKTRKQEEALLERAMNSQPSGPSDAKDSERVLWVLINDFTDSDNHAAALVWAKFLTKHHGMKGIYIAEPRHVDLGYYTTSREFGECIALVRDLEPRLEGADQPMKAVLAGNLKLTEDDINNSTYKGRELTENERKLLQRCIKPNKTKQELDAAKGDAIRHAKLLVMDFLSTMHAEDSPAFDTYIDHKCLNEGLESPINLKTHYHEELVFRTAKELNEFRTITESSTPLPDKAEELRRWYEGAISRKLREFENINNKEPWIDLDDYEVLFEEMRKSKRVIVFGGCSLTILKAILESKNDSLSKKVEYYQQGGTFTPELNILGKPLNFALNLEAAEFVFEHAKKLAKFRLIPTDTTKQLEFTLKGLTNWSAPIGLHSLAFYGKVDVWDLIDTPEEKQCPSASTQDIVKWRSKLVFDRPKYQEPDFRAHRVVMADLSAYLLSFTEAFENYETEHGVLRTCELEVKSTTNGKKQMILEEVTLEENEKSSVKALVLDLPKNQKIVLVDDTRGLIEKTIATGSSSINTQN